MRLDDYYSGIVRASRSKRATPPTHREAQRDFDERVRQTWMIAGFGR